MYSYPKSYLLYNYNLYISRYLYILNCVYSNRILREPLQKRSSFIITVKPQSKSESLSEVNTGTSGLTLKSNGPPPTHNF